VILVLAAALALTVPLKFLVSPVEPQSVPVDAPVSTFLARHGWQTGVEKKIAFPIIHATSGDCRMAIIEMEPRGTNLDRVDTDISKVGPVVFIFEGVLYREPPVRRTLLKYYWSRLQERLGFKGSLTPVLAVATSGKCSIDALPWGDIAWQS